MKLTKYLVPLIIIASLVYGQGSSASLLDRIKQVNQGLIEGYGQPLITAFGTGMASGLFHSAYSHDFLGFDLGLRAMYITVPNSADFFNGTAMVCSLNANDELVSYPVDLENMSTIFGPDNATRVPTPSANAVGIPNEIPAGLDRSFVPFAIPQLNLGLPFGLEIAVRYFPSFTFEGSKVSFIGFGAKEGLNRFPLLEKVTLPFAIALGGAYQTCNFKEASGQTLISTKTWNFQILASKRVALFEPYASLGLEGTSVNFHYDFEYQIPDTVAYVPSQLITEISEVDVTFHSQNHYRAIVGFTLYLGLFYLHYDYNITTYKTHNGIIGITFR